MKSPEIPVILDTDIGDDIDDTWALAMMLKSPELDVKLVSTDFGNTVYRAKLVAKMLEVAGRTDVPVGIGIRLNDGVGGQGPWVEDYDLGRYPGTVREDGVQAIVDAIMGSPEPVTLICIGPMPNIKAALEREPRIAEKSRFVGMHGSVRKGYDGSAEVAPEYNVKADVPACRAAFAAPWDVTITPVDSCGLVRLKGEKYRAVCDCRDPLTRAVVENYRIWLNGKPDAESSVLFDTVAVHLAYSTEFLVMEDMGIRVTDDGFAVEDAEARQMHVAIDWKDLAAYEDYLVERLTGGK
jgi:inosine-uridine nucleoside N-ribohydrolase